MRQLPHDSDPVLPEPSGDRLESWKEIAAYLKRDVTTVRRWERKEGLPVHRKLHDKLGTVYAFRTELDAWWDHGRQAGASAAIPASTFGRRRIAITASLVAAAVAASGFIAWRFIGRTDPASAIGSMAVLPLTLLSSDPDQEWLADGMTDALIAQCSKIPAMKVISRTSTRGYKGSAKALRTIASELGVDAILEGTVAHEGRQIHVSLQLFEAATERSLWAGTYRGELGSVLALQSAIATTVARRIKAEMTPAAAARLARVPSVDARAYEAYLKGRYHFKKGSRDSEQRAHKYLSEALAIQPDYAGALAAIALVYRLDARGERSAEGFRTASARALAAAESALRLDGDLSEAHAIIGWLKFFDLQWSAAEQAFSRAIALDASNADAHHGFGFYLNAMNQSKAAIDHLNRARQLDPLSPLMSVAAHWPYVCARRYEDAMRQLLNAQELEPDAPHLYVHIGAVRIRQERYAEAIDALTKATALGDTSDSLLAWKTVAFSKARKPVESATALRALTDRAQRGGLSLAWMARMHAALGNDGAALDWLERAASDPMNWSQLPTVRDPVWDRLRSHPRFLAVLERIGLPR